MFSKLKEVSHLPLKFSDPQILKETILTLFRFIAKYHSERYYSVRFYGFDKSK